MIDGTTDMVFKKNFLSYCIWIVYTVAAATCLFAFAAFICLKMGYPARIGFSACLGLLLAEAFACAFFHALRKRRMQRDDSGKRVYAGAENRMGKAVAEGIFVVAVLGSIFAMRVLSMPKALPESPLFDAAMVRAGVRIEPSFDSSVFFCLQILHFVFFLFGNKITAGYAFQIVMQLLAFILLYFAVRKISGVVPALCGVLFPGIIVNLNESATVLSPRTMIFFLFTLGLFFVSTVFGRKKRGDFVRYFLSGVYIGFFTGIEIAGCVLFFIALGSFFVRNRKIKSSEALIDTAGLVAGAGGGFVGYTFLNAAVNGAGFATAFGEWIARNTPGQVSAAQLGYIPFLGYDNVLVLAALCFGIFTFFLNSDSCGQGLWTVSAAVLAALAMTESASGECAAVAFLYTVFAILAGIAVRNVFPVPEEEKIQAETGEEASDTIVEEEEKNNMFDKGTPGKTVTVNVDGETRQIKLLDNPLTLPKKREHKAMDYDYDVPEDDDYDI